MPPIVNQTYKAYLQEGLGISALHILQSQLQSELQTKDKRQHQHYANKCKVTTQNQDAGLGKAARAMLASIGGERAEPSKMRWFLSSQM